jgi:hypothetical protein
VRPPALLLLSCLATALCACPRSRREPGRWVTCSCSWLTDFDDRASHKVEVCVPAGRTAETAAAECASRHVPGHFESCACEPPRAVCDGAEPCRAAGGR